MFSISPRFVWRCPEIENETLVDPASTPTRLPELDNVDDIVTNLGSTCGLQDASLSYTTAASGG